MELFILYIIGILSVVLWVLREYDKATKNMIEKRREEEYIKLWKENQELMKQLVENNELQQGLFVLLAKFSDSIMRDMNVLESKWLEITMELGVRNLLHARSLNWTKVKTNMFLSLFFLIMERLTVKQAAYLMGVSQQFIRVGLQTGRLPFGTAVKMSSRWTYYINEEKFFAYISSTSMKGR